MKTVSAVVAIDVSFVQTIAFPLNISKYAKKKNRDQINGKLTFRITSKEKRSSDNILSFN